MDNPKVLLDTDVIVNWLVQELETVSGRELWKAPHEIVRRAEDKSISAFISLTTLMEVRYLLRRKKAFSSRQVEDDLSAITSVIDVLIPDEISLLKANTLQVGAPIGPLRFDPPGSLHGTGTHDPRVAGQCLHFSIEKVRPRADS